MDASQLVRKHKYCTVCHHLMMDSGNECSYDWYADFENFVMCDLGLQIKMIMEGMLNDDLCM